MHWASSRHCLQVPETQTWPLLAQWPSFSHLGYSGAAVAGGGGGAVFTAASCFLLPPHAGRANAASAMVAAMSKRVNFMS